jgi:hypothetical protein
MSDLVGPGSHFEGHRPPGSTGRVQASEVAAERDRYIRAFNRLEKAVANHIKDRCIDSDDLEHVHRVVLRDLAEGMR